MKSAIPSDLLKLKAKFEVWRKTRAKRSKTPDRLLKAAAALLDNYSASMICRVCGINLRTLRRRSSSNTSPRRSPVPAPEFFPLSLTLSQPEVSSYPPQVQTDCRLLLERPDGARLSIFLPPAPDIFKDEVYVKELKRRFKIMGSDFDPAPHIEYLMSESSKKFDTALPIKPQKKCP